MEIILQVLTTGETSGAEPIGSGVSCWDLADEVPVEGAMSSDHSPQAAGTGRQGYLAAVVAGSVARKARA